MNASVELPRDVYAVLGNPVAHSRSPWIHQKFALQTRQALDYRLQFAELGQFAATVDELRRNERFRGCNVTVPFKLDALNYALASKAQLSARARLAGAVNTLRFDGKAVHADNTDGVGLVNDIVQRAGVTLRGARVVVLGAGGATRGILLPLFEAGVASVCVANRTLSKAADIVQAMCSDADVHALAPAVNLSARLTATTLEQAPIAGCDIVINATSASLVKTDSGAEGGSLLAALPRPGSGESGAPPVLAYDMVYGAEPSPFMLWGKAMGCRRVSDGLGMLVDQAAESFFLWRGVRPQTEEVYAGLRVMLGLPAPAKTSA